MSAGRSGVVRCVLSIALFGVSACAPTSPATDSAKADPAAIRIFDGHNDLVGVYINAEPRWSLAGRDIAAGLPGQSDLPRWRAGGFAGSMITVSSELGPREGPYFPTLARSIDWFDALAASHPDALASVRTPDEARAAMAAGRMALVMEIEGGEQIDGSLDNLRAVQARGVRMITLVYDAHNDIGDGALAFVTSPAIAGPAHGGLSPFGRELVGAMNDLGMMIDLSHAGEATALEAMRLSRAPVVFSHSGVRALADTPRNVSDATLRALKANGGVLMISFAPYLATHENWRWFDAGEREYARLKSAHPDDPAAIDAGMTAWEDANSQPDVHVSDVADQIDYAAKNLGRDHVGVGTDFGGMDQFVIPELADAAAAPALFAELARRGWTPAELQGLAGGNFMAVWRAIAAGARA
jgi:membrane dipeptidase